MESLTYTYLMTPAIPLLGTYPREMKAYLHIKICTGMFIATSLVIAKKYK